MDEVTIELLVLEQRAIELAHQHGRTWWESMNPIYQERWREIARGNLTYEEADV
jgi:hypothetical protein